MAKPRPIVSWIPVRLFADVIAQGFPGVTQWLRKAADLGLEAVEVYGPFLQQNGRSTVDQVKSEIDGLGLKVSMVTASPDLTHPDADQRRSELASMERYVRNAAQLGATAVRCTTGQAHPGLEETDGLDIVSDALLRLAEYALPMGVRIALENHYRDRMCMEHPDFAHRRDTFLRLFERVKDSPVMINLDCSNPLMVGEDAVDYLRVLAPRIISVHASDRMRGAYQHSVVGEGEVDYPTIFRMLADSDYSGWISIEDGNQEGDAGFERSLGYVRESIDRYWS